MKLKDAIDNAMVGNSVNPDVSLATIRKLVNTAKDFQTIIEAREKATQGEWFRTNDYNSACCTKSKKEHGSVCGGEDSYHLFTVENSFHPNGNADFAVTAANITSKYIGGE